MQKIDIKDAEIINLYNNNNYGSTYIANLFDCHPTTIRNILKRNKITIRKIKKYNINSNYFNEINTERKAYFLGLLMSDGHNNGDTVKLKLKSEDSYIIKELQKDLNDTSPLKIEFSKNGASYSYATFNGRNFCNNIENVGIVKNKTNLAKFPNIPEKFWSHFIRGVFDGDGCIYENGKTSSFTLTGNIDLIKSIQNILVSNCSLNKNKLYINHIENCSNIVNLVWSGNINIKKLALFLYKDSTIFLHRKYEKFNNVLIKPSKHY